MQSQNLIQSLTDNAERIRALVNGVTTEQARWKPSPDDWSILETLVHLFDEEREDFRVRLDLMLHKPGQAWPPINPAGWVTERYYNERPLVTYQLGFPAERRKSLAWLASLETPDWETVYTASWGPIRAGDLLAAWAAHDLIHLRQLVELHYAWTQRLAEPYAVDYAGEW